MSKSMPTRVFNNGNSQAVRIPQEFRLHTSEVIISKTVAGDLIIRPVATDRGTAFLQAMEGFDDSVLDAFVQSIEDARQDDKLPQERDEL